ncbi:MAG TPA: GntR family transcriptional regulator [Thermoleophilaceae bacterium]
MEMRVDRASPLSLGAQLEAALRTAIESGQLAPGDQLPSLRHVAAEAGVNVNTVRAAYARLEAAGAVSTEQGRGTFVAAPSGRVRRDLREQIAHLEQELARLPQPREQSGWAHLTTTASHPPSSPARQGARMLSTADLAMVRDELLERLQQLDTARAEVIRGLERLEHAQPASAPAPATRRSNPTLSGVRVRWVGA